MNRAQTLRHNTLSKKTVEKIYKDIMNMIIEKSNNGISSIVLVHSKDIDSDLLSEIKFKLVYDGFEFSCPSDEHIKIKW